MLVKELIKELLDCDMEEEVQVLLSKGVAEPILIVHDSTMRTFSHTGVRMVVLEPRSDLARM